MSELQEALFTNSLAQIRQTLRQVPDYLCDLQANSTSKDLSGTSHLVSPWCNVQVAVIKGHYMRIVLRSALS